VEISRSALRHNLEYVRPRLPAGTALCAIVKADAYGHGAAACAQVFCGAGVEWLAVTSVEEGARLRAAGIEARILVLAGFTAAEAGAIVAHRLTPAVWDTAQVRWLAAAAKGQGGAALAIHVKLETGMGRLGATAEQLPELEAALRAAPQLEVESVFSHLAASEAADPAPCERQRDRLLALAGTRRWHLLNSEATLRFADWGGMLARVGLALYGYSSQPAHAVHLRPALTWKAHVVAVKHLPAGHGVGYGPAFITPRPMRAATLAVGYADGYRRDFAAGAQVRLDGVSAPVIGAISMDLTSVDASPAGDTPLGSEVILMGPDAPETAATLAARARTIPYEVLCGISARVERRYVE
jgi:alanine racemase